MLKGPEGRRPDALDDKEESGLLCQPEGAESGHRTVARNAFYLMLGQAATTALSILFSAALARSLGASDFGLYFLIASFSAFAYVLVDWGQTLYVFREVARKPERGSVFLGTSLVLRIAGAALAAVPFGLSAWMLGYDAIAQWYCVAFIAVSLPFFLTQTFGMVFRAREKMGFDAWLSVVNKIALLGLTLAALNFGAALPGVLAAHALAGILSLAVASRLYHREIASSLRYSPQLARQILVGGSTFVTFSAVSNIQPYIDAVILSKLVPADVIGWYGAAKTIMGTLLAPALILGAASFPRLARAAANGGPITTEVQNALRPLLWLGALAAVGTFLFADDAIAIMYGRQNFYPSGVILKAYAPGLLLLFMNILFGYALFALDRANAFSVLKVLSVVVCTGLELVLIPIFQERTGNGGTGAVSAFVASEFLVLGGTIFLLRGQCLGQQIAVNMARTLGSAALTLLFFQWLPPLPFLIGASLCVITFFACSVWLGLIRLADIQALQALLRKERPAL